MTDVNPLLISVARESRGMTQRHLADAIGISQSKLSKYENGALQPSVDDLSKMSEALGYTEEFFSQPDEVFGFGSFCFYHRKRANMSVTQLRKIQAQMNVFRLQLQRVRRGITVETTNRFHSLDVDEFGGADAVAREARRLWGLPMGPVNNVVAAIERAGGIVWRTDFATRRLDAVSHVAPGHPPIFFVNSMAPNDRARFTLAHELGHVLMHESPSSDMEDQADEFASEFLMPQAEIGSSLRDLSLEKLPSLKAHWRVSMAAIIKRASDLEKISDRHYRSLFTELTKGGWRLREPIELSGELPSVVREMVRIHFQEHRCSASQLAKDAFLRATDEFIASFATAGETQSLRVIG